MRKNIGYIFVFSILLALKNQLNPIGGRLLTRKPIVSIVSAGLSKFGKRRGLFGRELFVEATSEAFEKCPNLDPRKDIKAAFIGMMSESLEHQGHTGPTVLDWAGLLPIQAFRTEGACGSSATAIRCGIFAIRSGLADIVLVGGVEKMTHRNTADVTEYLAMACDFPFEQWNGLTFPGLFAMVATAHMHKYSTTEEQMALVAVKNHHHGALNPKAHMQKEVPLEKAMSSRVIAWPLKLYDCSLITDGASCLVLSKPELARKFTDTPVHIIGSGQASDTIGLYERKEFTSLKAGRLAAQEAYKMAGVEASTIDVAEVHDCFTIAEILAYEDLGFCKPGEGGPFIEEGQSHIGGSVAVCTSGGLKAKGHPVGATGTAQAYEIYLQLTGQAGKRQVKGAEIGLTHNVGGLGATGVVNIYSRE
ncbi:MAG: thiolase domain-containing protein [Candidatus Bathyarchaeota archaeon]|nr:MAG: thiolase domain-containing protein [Candidatus Bathyarchaeota archaeon]